MVVIPGVEGLRERALARFFTRACQPDGSYAVGWLLYSGLRSYVTFDPTWITRGWVVFDQLHKTHVGLTTLGAQVAQDSDMIEALGKLGR